MFENFMAAMRSQGIEPPGEIIADGNFHRFSTKVENKNDTSGWYILFNGHINAGSYGDFSKGISKNWSSKNTNEMSEEEIISFEKAMEDARKARAENLKAQHKKAAEEANIIWDAAEPATEHEYLTEKNIGSHGLRVGRWVKRNEKGKVWNDVHDALLIPLTDGNKIWSLQAIFPTPIFDRNKDFLKGGRKRGLFHRIGFDENADTVYICEGYATGATIHELTKKPVYIAFDAGNLPSVGENVREIHPRANIIIAADNDQYPNAEGEIKNPGIKYAKKAQKTANAHMVYPEFSDDQLEGQPTDFNDLYNLNDMFVVLNQLTPNVVHVNKTEEFEHQDEKLTSHVKKIEKSIHVNSELTSTDPVDIDIYSPLPDVNGKGRPLSTIENLKEICKRLGVIPRYNVITKEEELIIPGESFSVDNQDNASFAWLVSWCSRFNMPIGQVDSFVTYLCDKNQHNPVTNWIESKKWDGVSRLNDFYDTVTAKDDDLKKIFMKRWMISAVAAVFNPNGVSAHGVLVFQGAQNLGKTSWLLSLAPKDLNVVREGVQLDTRDRDSKRQAVSSWIVELGELDSTFRKSDIAQLKSHITSNQDVLRKPYARRDSKFARRTVYFGSVNPRNYLNDPTGNRRYWTIECEHINYNHDLDMQQVWVEFYEMYKNGEKHFLTTEEMKQLNEYNEEFTAIDPIDEKIRCKLDWASDHESWRMMTTSEALSHCGMERPSKSDISRAAHIIRQLNNGCGERKAGKRLLLVPPPVQE